MDQHKAYTLLSRQLKDILSQAERILNGDNSTTELETFSLYSSEMKRYIQTRLEDPVIKDYALSIPNINYERTRIRIWHIVLLPYWFVLLYIDYVNREKAVDEVREARNKYDHLQVMIHSFLHRTDT